MKKTFNEIEKETIRIETINLLLRHNNVLKKTNRRLLSKDDEGFLAGCKRSFRQLRCPLTDKQYLTLYKIINEYKNKKIKSTSIKKSKPTKVIKEKHIINTTNINNPTLSDKQQKLKELLSKLK